LSFLVETNIFEASHVTFFQNELEILIFSPELLNYPPKSMIIFLFVSSPFKSGACGRFPGLAPVKKRIGHAAIN
jgi:hypothetical protein